MAKICISALLLQLLYTSIQGQYSPCPDRFTYIKKPGSDETIGEIEIRNPSINNLELRLKVDLKVDTQLPTSFVGGVELTKSKHDAIRDVLEGRPLLYHVYFPVQNPLPTVHRIWFNNYPICSGPEVSGSVVTIVALEHNFKIIIRPEPDHNQLNPLPQNGPAEQKPNNSGNPLVSPFTSEITEQTPVATTESYELRRSKAGHCLKRSDRTNETIPANILSVALGRYKLMDFNEQGSVTMDVASHISHPNHTHTTTADSDLAILILRSSVEFTVFIRPICLWSPWIDSRRLEQTDGIIVGWGGDEHGNLYTEEPRLASMPIVKADVCLRSHPSFFNLTSERTFCAGGPNIINRLCSGDSGYGLVIFDSVTDRYQLRREGHCLTII